MKYLKFLGNDRQPYHGGIGQWPEPGVWTETIENPVPCMQGYHLCRLQDTLWWCDAPTLWVVEAEGVIAPDYINDKVVAKRARLIMQLPEWNEINQRLFATDCAEHVLHLFESKYPDDKRPRQAIEIARKFALGNATEEELTIAANHVLRVKSCLTPIDPHCNRSSLHHVVDSAWWVTLSWPGVVQSVAWAARHAQEGQTEESNELQWQLDTLFSKYLKLNPEEFE